VTGMRAHAASPATAWTLRSEEERRSAAVFSDLLGLLADGDVSLDVVREVHGIVGDEILHARMCADMARALGAPPPCSRVLPRVGPEPVTAEERRWRALEIVLVEGAVGETISSALFAAGRRLTEEPRARAVLSRILEDEARHARCFWGLLDRLLSPPDCEHLAGFVRAALGAIEQMQVVPSLASLARGDVFDPGWSALGVLSPEARVEAFYRAIEKRVLPALTQRGLDGAGAWADRYGCASSAADAVRRTSASEAAGR
jgi:hypothetical protein